MAQGTYLCLHPNTQNTTQAGNSTETETAGGNTRDFGEFGSAETALFYFTCSAISGTSATLQVFIDEWDEFSQQYVQIFGFSAVTAVTSSPMRTVVGRGAYDTGNTKTAIGQALRCRWTLTGTTPSATFRVGAWLITAEGAG